MNIGLLSANDAPALGCVIQALTMEEIDIDCVIIDSKSPSAREMAVEDLRTEGKMEQIHPSEFEALGIPYFHVVSHQSKACQSLICERSLDILVNAGTPRILGTDILMAATVGVINCHPGLLPKFRGCTCVEWAVYLDEPIGNTVHFMAEGIDEGPIILQESLEFSKDASYSDVRVKVYLEGFALLARAISKVIKKGLTPDLLSPQGEGSYFDVIPQDKLDVAIRKLSSGEYLYQRD